MLAAGGTASDAGGDGSGAGPNRTSAAAPPASPRSTTGPSALPAASTVPAGVVVDGRPLTFPPTDPRLADYLRVPAGVGVARTSVVFARLPYPYPLGAVRGRSSTVRMTDLVNIHSTRPIAGVPLQHVRGQTPYFPNYEPVRQRTASIIERYGPQLKNMTDLLATNPWDAMWAGRTRHLFLFDPTKLDDAQVQWLFQVLTFMFQYRRHIWQRLHWFPLSRQPQLGAVSTAMYAARMTADRELTTAFAALCAVAPPGVGTSLFWCEPAFWCLPAKQCSWVVDDPSTRFATQLRELDLLEPVRVGWASAPGRFVEALISEQLDVLDSHQGYCWELPAPWNDPAHRPQV
ncbi:hypothetical protein ATCC90586_012052 [Pythium insidiosum]|nr:hypothetical protein ATCC90586_012052 [Pythium insidiosum]